MSSAPTLDREALRQKYREERDRRLAVADRGTYTYLDGDLADRYDQDPWATTDGKRDPVVREVEAIVVGGGFAGLLAGANLRKAGVPASEIVMIERGGDFGGTWYWNRYPGLSCDTEAYVYLPLLEETGYVPTQKYAMGPEIREHSQRIGRHFGLYDCALFQTRISDASWDEEIDRWIVKTDRGDELRGRFLWLCSGLTNRPKLPGIPGIRDFKGHSFHTMRWDYGYTGGGPDGNLTGLKDKRVGLIGTGATAIQCVPHLGASAKEFYVFQRTPSAVNVRANRPTDPDWAKSLQPGWQMDRMENFLSIVSGIPQDRDLVDDAWTWNFANVMRIFEEDKTRKQPKDAQELADFERMSEIRARVDTIVEDRATAEALKAWYGLNCKRPTFHDEYLQTFNRPNVTLVDTQGRGVERATERGLIANGQDYELDCIVYATGFDTASGMVKILGVDPKGVGGQTFIQRLMSSFSTLHGIHVSGLPNMFVISGPQSTLATTLTYGLAVQTAHCARIVEHCRANGITRIEAKPAAEAQWVKDMAEMQVDHRDYYAACTPGIMNGEGKGTVSWDYFYGGGPVAYRRVLDRWFDERLADDLDLQRA